MRITVTARHCEISDELKARAQTVLERLGGVAERPVEGAVVFDTGPKAATVEIRLHISRGDTFVGTGEGKEHRSALDRAEEKVKRQLDKHNQPGHRGRRAEEDVV